MSQMDWPVFRETMLAFPAKLRRSGRRYQAILAVR
jgi:hypothetical protein